MNISCGDRNDFRQSALKLKCVQIRLEIQILFLFLVVGQILLPTHRRIHRYIFPFSRWRIKAIEAGMNQSDRREMVAGTNVTMEMLAMPHGKMNLSQAVLHLQMAAGANNGKALKVTVGATEELDPVGNRVTKQVRAVHVIRL